ncbi:RNI-like protein [Ceraceosorus guamensis]|uniref:RNI-like protein n=1 Tax=Ceraceosorus guamensis TaxID=1522189 RepID=A0A316WC38_9BASI|nr:RNI-like protein [Ceraceosorus guamensis]PWN45473.1 RNI-like protein [Ceraceosorus guamensis]
MSEAVADESKIFRLKGEKQLKLSTAEDAAPYVAQIEAIDGLQEVHFGGNSLGTAACVAFAEVLKTKTTLRVADFADIFTGRLIDEIPDALRALCNALLHHEHLDELDLSDNAFGGRSAEPMVELLSNNHSIKVLKLNNNGLGIDGGRIVSGALTVAAKKLADSGIQSQLHTVICGRNRLENGSAPQWAEAFAAHKTLRVVRMYQNGIRMEGIQAIVAGLRECKDLEWLDLGDNTATLKGSIAIATSLPSWPKLQTLDLTDCLLRPRGGVLVANALAKGHNTELKKLQLGYCELDSKALSALAKAITLQLSNLTRLEINGNFADEEDDCIEAIKSALEEHGHLDGLDDLDDLDPEGEIDDSEDEASDEESGENEEKETGAVAAGVPTADQDTVSPERSTIWYTPQKKKLPNRPSSQKAERLSSPPPLSSQSPTQRSLKAQQEFRTFRNRKLCPHQVLQNRKFQRS